MFNIQHKNFKLFILSSLLIHSYSTVSIALDSLENTRIVSPPTLKNEYFLSDVIQENSSGLQVLPSQARKTLFIDARTYIGIRKHSIKRNEQAEFQSACQKNIKRSPFCVALKDLSTRSKSTHFINPFKVIYEKTRQHLRRKEAQKLIEEGDTAKLATLSDSQIRDALKGFSSAQPLEKISNQLIQSPACKNPNLSLLLASKTEEFLPDPTLRDRAIALYGKSAPCGETENSARAKFRASLLNIWKGDCQSAQTQLKALANQNQPSDYRSRALYWETQCSMILKDHKTSAEAKRQLIEKFPFSLHALLVQKENPPNQEFPIPSLADSPIQFRSENNSSLDAKIEATEALIELHETALARELMDSLSGSIEKTAPEFRLYAGYLYHKLDQYLKKFKVLNAVFKDSPQSISRPALELYYAQNTLQDNDLSSIEVDGKLLLSLIRQESAFNVKARSPAGAMGLMQVMPTTARRMERIRRTSELFIPAVNLRIGSKYFSYLMKNYNGDAELALAAYNAGPGRVDSWVKRYPIKDRILFLDLIPFKETRDYVASIARNYFWYVTLSPVPIQELTAAQPLAVRKEPRRNIAEVFSLFGT